MVLVRNSNQILKMEGGDLKYTKSHPTKKQKAELNMFVDRSSSMGLVKRCWWGGGIEEDFKYTKTHPNKIQKRSFNMVLERNCTQSEKVVAKKYQ